MDKPSAIIAAAAVSSLLAACTAPDPDPGSPAFKQSRTILNQGVALYQQGDYAAALPLFKQSATLGNLKAPRYIGLIYLNGSGLPKDPARAFAQFQTAAAKGDITSQYWLGWCYEHGAGTAQNYAQALHWYQISAQRGDHIAAPAMNALGAMYEKGEGVPASRDTAVAWYRKAAAAVDADVKTAAEAALARLGAAQ